MPDMHHLIQIDGADAAAAYAALTTRDEITGWWTSRAEVPDARVAWTIDKAADAVIVRLDHNDFAEVDDMFRIVTVGWAQMLLSLKAYLESGRRRPFFTF